MKKDPRSMASPPSHTAERGPLSHAPEPTTTCEFCGVPLRPHELRACHLHGYDLALVLWGEAPLPEGHPAGTSGKAVITPKRRQMELL